ncbi:shootin-1-like, partial [Clarias magur]
PVDALRIRKKPGTNTSLLKKPEVYVDVKNRAVDEIMERIKKGVVLKPTQKPPQTGLDEDSLEDQKAEKRKAAVREWQLLSENIKKTGPRRMQSRNIRHDVEEPELQKVFRRRRQALLNAKESLHTADQ